MNAKTVNLSRKVRDSSDGLESRMEMTEKKSMKFKKSIETVQFE